MFAKNRPRDCHRLVLVSGRSWWIQQQCPPPPQPQRSAAAFFPLARGSFRIYHATIESKTSHISCDKSSHYMYTLHDGRRKGFVMLQPSTTSVCAATPITIPQRQQRRWMGAPNRHNRKKRFEKSDLDPNDQKMEPRFLDSMSKEYELIEKRFTEKLDHQLPGRNRGIECARQIVLEEGIEKKASTACGNLYLNTWIYRRFTLPLGYKRITDVPGVVLANKLIREGTTIRFNRYKDPKNIILEMYRYPKVRPTKTQKKYLKMDKEAEMTPEQAHRMINFEDDDDEDEFLTPSEEAYEQKRIENRTFAANPYNDRRRE